MTYPLTSISPSDFIADLLAKKARRDQEVEAQRQATAAQVRPEPEPVKPLVDQLRQLLATLPPSQRNRISTPLLVPHLTGKYRQHPHTRNIGQALRQLGYVPVRDWRAAGDAGRRFWILSRPA